MNKNSKKFLLFLIAALAVLLIVFSIKINHTASRSGITLAVATDLHYLSPALTDHGAYFEGMIHHADGKATEYADELTDAFVAQMVNQSPDVLILSGDLTFNGEKQSHLDLAKKLQLVEDAGIPVLVLPGNHDLKNFFSASFHGDSIQHEESISAEDFTEIYQNFGYENTLAKDPDSLSYITELAPNLRILMLDANTSGGYGVNTTQTLAWVEQQLKDAQAANARVISVSHQNLLQHSPLFSGGYQLQAHEELLALYEKYNVICNLSGHIHIQHIAQSDNGLPEFATSSLAVNPGQYGLLTLDNGTADYHTVPVDVAAWAKETGNSNPELLNFAEYIYDFFWDTAYRQASAMYAEHPSAEAIARFFADINTAYFAGRPDTITWDETLLESLQSEDAFLSPYMQSIADEPPVDNTIFTYQYEESSSDTTAKSN